eukprot:TRINITY_DN29783_c0_g1_i1.p3 TRINITY_DN29783_c0_g1~~TRINITY_DN29783_c0_g1_i1.p3  ORF type:complete len:237 (+),score=53.38 TRINITY_DN29783_c0_g1_i1:73-783(+)
MAVSTLRWLEGTLGVDILGDAGGAQDGSGSRRAEPRHFSGDHDSDEALAGDQILYFLERRFPDLDSTEEERAEIAELKRSYVNACNAVAFHDGQLCELVAALWAARREYTRTRAARDKVRVENAKLDISDRKDKRFFKRRELEAAAAALRERINVVQLRALADGRNPWVLPAAKPAEAEDDRDPHPAAPTCAGAAPCGGDGEVLQSATGVRGLRRRRMVSDAELTAALRHSDVLPD